MQSTQQSDQPVPGLFGSEWSAPIDPARRDYLVRHLYLNHWSTDTSVDHVKAMYVADEISLLELEMLLDALLLGKGADAAVRCPRCGALCYGIGSADNGLIAVRCSTPDCHFVGYTE